LVEDLLGLAHLTEADRPAAREVVSLLDLIDRLDAARGMGASRTVAARRAPRSTYGFVRAGSCKGGWRSLA